MAREKSEHIQDREFRALARWVEELEKAFPEAVIPNLSGWVLVEWFGVPRRILSQLVRESDGRIIPDPSVTWSRRLAGFKKNILSPAGTDASLELSPRVHQILVASLQGLSIYAIADLFEDELHEAHVQVTSCLTRLASCGNDMANVLLACHLGSMIRLGVSKREGRETFDKLIHALLDDKHIDPYTRVSLGVLKLTVSEEQDDALDHWRQLELEFNRWELNDPILRYQILEGSRGWTAAYAELESRTDLAKQLKWGMRIRLAEGAALSGQPRKSERHVKILKQGRPPARYRRYLEALSQFNRDHWFGLSYDVSRVPRRRDYL